MSDEVGGIRAAAEAAKAEVLGGVSDAPQEQVEVAAVEGSEAPVNDEQEAGSTEIQATEGTSIVEADAPAESVSEDMQVASDDEAQVSDEEVAGLPKNISKGLKRRLDNLAKAKREAEQQRDQFQKELLQTERYKWEKEQAEKRAAEATTAAEKYRTDIERQYKEYQQELLRGQQQDELALMEPTERELYETKTRLAQLEKNLEQLSQERAAELRRQQVSMRQEQGTRTIENQSLAAIRAVGLDSDPDFREEFSTAMVTAIGRMESEAAANGRRLEVEDVPPDLFINLAQNLKQRRDRIIGKAKSEWEAKKGSVAQKLSGVTPSPVAAGSAAPGGLASSSDIPSFGTGIEAVRQAAQWAKQSGRWDDVLSLPR